MQCTPEPVVAKQVVKQPRLVLVLVLVLVLARVRELQFDRRATPKERRLVMLQVKQRLQTSQGCRPLPLFVC